MSWWSSGRWRRRRMVVHQTSGPSSPALTLAWLVSASRPRPFPLWPSGHGAWWGRRQTSMTAFTGLPRSGPQPRSDRRWPRWSSITPPLPLPPTAWSTTWIKGFPAGIASVADDCPLRCTLVSSAPSIRSPSSTYIALHLKLLVHVIATNPHSKRSCVNKVGTKPSESNQ